MNARSLISLAGSYAIGGVLFGYAIAGAATPDRIYRFGDDPGEDAIAGAAVGAANTTNPNTTLDSQGDLSNLPTFSDLMQAGGPVYVNSAALNRPDAGANELGIQFDGSNDRLTITNGLGYPEVGDDPFGDPPIPNYTNIRTRVMQGWARPTGAGGARQDIVNDTYQFGVHITEDNTWGFNFGSTVNLVNTFDFDTGEIVAFDDWTHLMHRTFDATHGALYIDGVAVRVTTPGSPFYHGGVPAEAVGTPAVGMSFGSNLAGDSNFFQGELDDWVVSVADSAQFNNGSNYGGVNLGVDNQYIVSLDLVPGDVNGDGIVNGDGTGPAATDDVRFFANQFFSQRIVDGQLLGDLVSRTENADLNFDGVTDLLDWHMLRSNHASGASLNLAAVLGGAVPEPSSAAMVVFALAAIALFGRGLQRVGA